MNLVIFHYAAHYYILQNFVYYLYLYKFLGKFPYSSPDVGSRDRDSDDGNIDMVEVEVVVVVMMDSGKRHVLFSTLFSPQSLSHTHRRFRRRGEV